MGTAPTTESELVAAAQAGDGEAFAELYRTHLGIVRRFLGPRIANRDDVEDLVQETFADAWEQLGQYRHTSAPFRAWLIGRARGALIHYGWARWRHQVAVTDARETLRAQLRGDTPTQGPDDEVGPELAAAVDRLTPHKRRCVQLRYVEGLSIETVAELSSVQPGTMRSVASKAVAELRRNLDPTFSAVA
jgi:RNA polymerase sigma-70 factor, ECF subfamily